MAIMIRWRMPPENWCGNAFTRCFAPGMDTRSISCTARSSASDLFIPRCLRNISAICQPTGNTGFNDAQRILEDHRDLRTADPRRFSSGARMSVPQ